MFQNVIAILVKKASLEFDKIANPMLAEYDLTLSQFKILRLISAFPNQAVRTVDIEREFSITHPSAIGLLDNLESKGFVSRIPNPNDGRGKLIVLTEKGQAIQPQLDDLSSVMDNALIKNLSPEEQDQLTALLQKMLAIDKCD